MLFLMIFCFGAGIYVNTAAGASFLVTFLTYISPMRYSTELLMRRILAGKMGGDYVLDIFGFDWGSSTCIMMLMEWTLFYFVVGWLVLVWKTRQI